MALPICGACGASALTFNGKCADCYALDRVEQRQPPETRWYTNERRGLSGGNHRTSGVPLLDEQDSSMDALLYGDFRHVPDFTEDESNQEKKSQRRRSLALPKGVSR